MRKSRGFRFVAAAVAGAVLTLTGIGSAVAATPPTAEATAGPSIESDQADYAPGSTVVLTGAGWQPGESVHLYINDDEGRTWDRNSDVTAADDGTITDTFSLPDWFVATYKVTATGAVSGVVTGGFTDGNVQLHVNPTGAPVTFTAISYATTNCSGTGTSSQVAPEGNVSSAKSSSTRLQAPDTVTSPGTTYQFSGGWTFVPGNNSNASYTTIAGSSDICVTGFDSGRADATANYTATPTSLSTTTQVGTSGSPSTYGNDVTFTATVSASTSPTAGSVTFKDGSTTLCDRVALSAVSSATCQTSTLGAGTHSITATYSPSGSYVGSTSSVLTQTVNKRTVMGSFTANNKAYDGTTAATIATSSLTNTLPGDDVQLTGMATFADPNVGSDKTVTLNNPGLSGQASDNYLLGNTAAIATTANITPYGLSASFTAANKTYDGTTTATISAPSLTGVKSGDSVTVSVSPDGTGSFATKDVGNGIRVDAAPSAFTLGGAQFSNYSITSVNPTTANITPLHITGAFTAADKTYDGTNAATITGRSLVGAVKGDDVSLGGGSATFPDKNVGTGRDVTLAEASLAGAARANYVLDSVATTKADITPLPVSASFSTATKVYDGTDSAVVNNPTLHGILGTDQVTISGGTAHFSDKNVGTSKPVTAAPDTFELAGNDAVDYELDSVAATSADITVRDVTVGFSASDKTYDGNNVASISAAAPSNALVGDDLAVDFTKATAQFDGNAAGSHQVNAAGFVLSGNDKDNYTITHVTPTTATIKARHLTATFTAANKVYDRTTDASVTGFGFDKLVAGDVVTLTGKATFDTKNVGTGKTVTLNQPALAGPDAGNYVLDSVATTTATITAAGLTSSMTVADKVYDGSTSADITSRTLDGVKTGDDVSLTGGTATFADKNVGSNKTVTAPLSSFSLGGTDAGNYSLGTGNVATTASISKRDLTISFGADNKTYDGGTTAHINGAAAVNPVKGDDVGVDSSNAVAAFADKNVGTSKDVSASGFGLTGADAGNYTIQTVQQTQADITPLTISGTFTAADKVWDGTTSATITGRSLHGVLGNDDVQIVGGTATFSDPTVGTDKTVTGTGFSLTGADADNYRLDPAPLTTTASIRPLYSGTGFYAPVNMSTTSTRVWNTIKGGQTVPLKFEIFNATSGVEQTSLSVFGADAVAQAKAFSAPTVSCLTGEASSTDPVEMTTTGGTSLRYDSTAGQYIQNWKTPTTAGSCYAVTVKTVDGTTVGPAYFKITK